MIRGGHVDFDFDFDFDDHNNVVCCEMGVNIDDQGPTGCILILMITICLVTIMWMIRGGHVAPKSSRQKSGRASCWHSGRLLLLTL